MPDEFGGIPVAQPDQFGGIPLGGAPSPPQPEAPPSLAGFGKNVLSSAGKFYGGVASTIAHPIDTITGLAKLGIGLVASKNPHTAEEFPESAAVANAFGQMYKDRYGSWDDVKRTAYEDPVGFAGDASMVLGAAGAAASKLGGMNALGTIGRAAEATAGAINPISGPVKALGAAGVGNAAGTLAANVLGKETGAGAEAIKTMWKTPEARALAAMRGDISGDDIANDFKSALQNSKDARAQAYQQQLAKIQQQSGTVIDRQPIDAALNNQLQKFRVSPGKQPGQLDFSASPIADTGQGDIQKVHDLIKGWQDWSPEGADALKRRIDDTYSLSGQARSFTTGMRNAVKSQLVSQIPDYANMTKGYAEASDAIQRVESDLSLGQNANPGTAARKLATALNQNQKYRQMLIESLQRYAEPGVDLKGELAGAHLSEWAPRGIMGPGAALWALGHVMTGHPGALALLASTSPRLMGELTAATSKWAPRLAKPATIAGTVGAAYNNPNAPAPITSPEVQQ